MATAFDYAGLRAQLNVLGVRISALSAALAAQPVGPDVATAEPNRTLLADLAQMLHDLTDQLIDVAELLDARAATLETAAAIPSPESATPLVAARPNPRRDRERAVASIRSELSAFPPAQAKALNDLLDLFLS